MQLQQQLRSAKNLRSSNEGNNIHAGRISTEHPQQYYKFRINHSSDLNLSLSGLKADANLALLDRRGKMLGQSIRKGRLNESISRTLNKGTYYVRVSRRQGKTDYRLNLLVGSDDTNTAAATLGQPWQTSQLVEQVLALTNAQRQQAGLQPLRMNAQLSVAAQAHSEDMAFNDFFGHVSSNGATIFDRVEQAGYSYDLAAENVAVGYTSASAVVQAWMNSPGHRANILYPDLQEIGIGFYFLGNDSGNANYRYYWTQDFGTPR